MKQSLQSGEKTYRVEITETLKRVIEVKATSQKKAEEIVEDGWKNEVYVLDYNDFVSVDFAVKKQSKI